MRKATFGFALALQAITLVLYLFGMIFCIGMFGYGIFTALFNSFIVGCTFIGLSVLASYGIQIVLGLVNIMAGIAAEASST